jgi:hypothetical protein
MGLRSGEYGGKKRIMMPEKIGVDVEVLQLEQCHSHSRPLAVDQCDECGSCRGQGHFGCLDIGSFAGPS